MKVNPREKRFLIVGGILVGVMLIYYGAADLLPSPAKLAAEVAAKKRRLMDQRSLLSQEPNFKARVEQMKKRFDQDKSKLLTGDNPNVAGAALQSILKDLADQNSVEIIRKDIQREQKVQDGLVRIPVHIETTCNMDQLVQFLTAIENYDKHLVVDELMVTSYKMQKKTEIRPSFTVSGYILTEPRPGEKAAAP